MTTEIKLLRIDASYRRHICFVMPDLWNSHIRWQHTETPICYLRRPRGQLLHHALQCPCIRCGGPKGMEPAAGTFMGTRGSWPLQDGIKDLSSLHAVTVPNCLTCRTLVMTLFMLRHVRIVSAITIIITNMELRAPLNCYAPSVLQ